MPPHEEKENEDLLSHAKVSMQNVMRWTELVVEGLQSVKWKVAGYAPKTSEGSSNEANLEAPVYTISNPNAVLDRLTNMYSFIPFMILHYFGVFFLSILL